MELTDEQVQELMEQARDAANHAYAPYSSFPVGAAALLGDGSIVTGANIENASFGLTCCAERVAIFRGVMAGQTEVRAIAVWAPRARGCTPCGACRQVMNEWRPRDGDMVVILDGENGPDRVPLSELLPRAFGPRDLES